MAKKKIDKIDGLDPTDIAKIRIAIRKVWSWSYPRKLCLKRCADPNGWLFCEKCHKKTPTIKVDHIKQVGDVDSGFIKRLFCPSTGLQGLCKKCHDLKTKEERSKSQKKKCLPRKKDQSLPEVDPNQLPLPLLSRAGIKV